MCCNVVVQDLVLSCAIRLCLVDCTLYFVLCTLITRFYTAVHCVLCLNGTQVDVTHVQLDMTLTAPR